MGVGLIGVRINTSEGRNGAPMSKPRHIPNLRHELGAEGVSHTVQRHNDRVLRESSGQFQHLRFQLHRGLGNSVEGINGLPNQPLGQIILRHHSNQILCIGVNLSSPVTAEVVDTTCGNV